MEKRYQVFVSSTFADLIEERRVVMHALMELSCIPAGMELFPASDEAQLDFIKRVIDDCDYYLLIIGGRYGSVTSEGVSYTEKEYDYAIERGLKVVALLHRTPEEISFKKSEVDPALRERLTAFRERVSAGRLVQYWKTAEELRAIVVLSMLNTIKQFPAVGWMRGDRSASEDILTEINNLRKEKEHLLSTIAANKPPPFKPIANLADLDESFTIKGSYWTSQSGTIKANRTVTWKELYGVITPYLVSIPSAKTVKDVIAAALFGVKGSSPAVDDQDFQTIGIQLQAVDLVQVKRQETTSGGMGLFWYATAYGKQLGLELRAIRTTKASPQGS